MTTPVRRPGRGGGQRWPDVGWTCLRPDEHRDLLACRAREAPRPPAAPRGVGRHHRSRERFAGLPTTTWTMRAWRGPLPHSVRGLSPDERRTMKIRIGISAGGDGLGPGRDGGSGEGPCPTTDSTPSGSPKRFHGRVPTHWWGSPGLPARARVSGATSTTPPPVGNLIWSAKAIATLDQLSCGRFPARPSSPDCRSAANVGPSAFHPLCGAHSWMRHFPCCGASGPANR